MERVEQLRQQLKEALNLFRDLQQRKRLYLLETHKTILEILMKNMSENFRLRIQDYFELRNESLHATLRSVDEALNLASDAHGRIAGLRSQLIDACNDAIRPLVKTDGSCLLLDGRGVADLQNVSTKTEQSVLQINDLQIKYSNLMADVEEKTPQKIDAILNDTEDKNKNADQEREREVAATIKANDEELEKAVQVLESMEKMKEEMECLFQILRKPNTAGKDFSPHFNESQ